MGTRPSRRALLFGGATTMVGAAAGLAGAAVLAPRGEPGPVLDAHGANGAQRIGFHGQRQPGIETPAPAHAVFIGLDLRRGSDRAGERDALERLLRLLSQDAARLMDGRGVLADTEPELAAHPARLTVTFGLGPHAVGLLNRDLAPRWLRPLEAFGIDELDAAYGQSDLLLQLCCDDPVTLAHARRALLKDTRSLASTAWVQAGFRPAYGSAPDGSTMRNLFGQLDGSANPSGERLERALWGGENLEPWIENGTSLVLRRIRMDLDGWDEADRPGRDFSLGRRQGSGAPLHGGGEHDSVDPGALDELGLPLLSADSHVARALPRGVDEVIWRRGYKYVDGVESGLLFASYQADVEKQFLPIQRRLAGADLLNQWTTPLGSAVYAIPPGCLPGGFIGGGLPEAGRR
ncbi:Dyp-type peroxidase [Paeniglutamicibacter cryotolerans]|uniref:Dye decolorizing peroxidase n=1 Tax=Paeniglutamicibacter cryotolerans TaxID=670079 RepID=A0A839QIH0_9MICC|nr:Dyp-type peroxidase [Paeniglutamicibacter cryotolerans]MBB2994325.1 dye decolorizing peroxidase [Paeniglutamicibacter cryotolerans]